MLFIVVCVSHMLEASPAHNKQHLSQIEIAVKPSLHVFLFPSLQLILVGGLGVKDATK